MFTRPFLVALALVACLATPPSVAQATEEPSAAVEEVPAGAEPLMRALRIDALVDLIRQEGIGYAADLERDMFPGRGGADWLEMVGEIYDTGRMTTIVQEGLGSDLDPAEMTELTEFFTSSRGQEIVELEIGARRAMMDPAVEEASAVMLDRMRADGDGRLELLEDFATVNDLVEMNVTGALNANYAFYSGLNAAGAFDRPMGEDDMVRDVWAQEGAIRSKTDTWVFSYLALAYQPLSEEDLRAYVELCASEPGRQLNANLFTAFGEMFRTLSYELGLSAARFMAGEDL
ncbi:DUF2059 domain-containing protein [Tropicimonas isoalkanivorans]|uniref:DUF2059 domain-containing protein n=1 Tax=Tropicimonas isoalkanivorans TaxID=441112 RepID=A0A1I1DAD1_9RHOB|nr:DUF2059 domain-containing protein [Tropicimonas isoalkanivorans]SFB71891.1 hypothetical protein SAMN04488094_10199 [Tropicimonas isoalkanivorans]